MHTKEKFLSPALLLMFTVATVAVTLTAREHTASPTIATVRGEPIFLNEIQRREALLTRNRPAQEGTTELRKQALRDAIRERILLQAAAAEGVFVTDSEVTAFVAGMQRSAREVGATEASLAFQNAATALAITEDEFARDPRVIKEYGRLMTIGRMRNILRDRLPAAERLKPNASHLAVEHFLVDHFDSVLILE